MTGQSLVEVYFGRRHDQHTTTICYRDQEQKVHQLPHVVYHSPTGMEWGYGGSGPSDLALSILAHHMGNRAAAQPYYQAFKWDFVAKFDQAWELSPGIIEEWLDRKKGGN